MYDTLRINIEENTTSEWRIKMSEQTNEPNENMTVDLELDDGRNVTCDVITVLEVEGKSYIVLLPQGQNPDAEENEVWFYELIEDENDPDKEPELKYIENDEDYEKVADAFDEFLDDEEFDELSSDDEE